MTRPAVTLALLLAFCAAGFGWRTLVQVRRHGDTGWRFARSGPDRVVGPLLALAVALLGLGPALALALAAADAASPAGITALTGAGALGRTAAVVGVALMAGAGVLTVVAQVHMGASWRIGVQRGERTDLVTSGLFARVRNPIFTGMLALGAGAALAVPNAPTIAGAVLLWATLQLQVRLVEEPHLREVHGAAYLDWAAGAGRFLPGLGRLDPGATAPRSR